jgi:Tfp pilus assembly protein PilX
MSTNPRLQLLDLARRGIALLGADPSRGAQLIVHLCEGLHLALLDLGGAELRARKAEASLAEAEKIIVALEARVRSEFDVQTVSRSSHPLLALCR